MRAAIVGQGYVGLPLAVEAAYAGHLVAGIEISTSLVDLLNMGRSPTGDVSDARLGTIVSAGQYRATMDFSVCQEAEVIVICVPTPYEDESPDLSYIRSAGEAVADHLSRDALVVLESTTFPGTTEEVLRPILEEGSGLVAGIDFELAFSPERIDPGNKVFGLSNTPKIVGGITPRSTKRARAFYGTFVEQVVEVSSAKSAEMAKLLENTFRHINIALVNELAVLARDMQVDIWEVIEAAASKPFGFMPFRPGPGVGGHCIPVDPMYLSWRVKQFGGAARFIELAREVNDSMPVYCVDRVTELLSRRGRPIEGARVLLIGVAYKRDVADLRDSPAHVIVKTFSERGASVSYHDPHVARYEVGRVGELKSAPLEKETLRSADCVVILADHSAVDYRLIKAEAPLIFDTKNVYGREGENIHRL